MNVGILGLGLIGGSMARAFSKADHTVFAFDKDESILSFAELAGAVHGKLDEATVNTCDLILLAIYPGGCIGWLEENAQFVGKNALVMDLWAKTHWSWICAALSKTSAIGASPSRKSSASPL